MSGPLPAIALESRRVLAPFFLTRAVAASSRTLSVACATSIQVGNSELRASAFFRKLARRSASVAKALSARPIEAGSNGSKNTAASDAISAITPTSEQAIGTPAARASINVLGQFSQVL